MMPFPANINVKSPISPPMAAKFLAIASGKGGVGKTWLAITLAHAMAKLGARPLLFDGDLGLANVDIQLGLMPKRDLAAVFDGNLALASAKLHFAAGGFDIIAGRSGTGALSILAPQRIADLRSDLAELADAYDRIILDLGAGIDRTVRQLASLAGTALVVTSEEPTALTDAYALIKVLRGADPTADIRVVVNMAQTPARWAPDLSDLGKGVRILSQVPPDAGRHRACRPSCQGDDPGTDIAPLPVAVQRRRARCGEDRCGAAGRTA